MIWNVLTAHCGATAAGRTHRISYTARLRSSHYHHTALVKKSQIAGAIK